MQAVSSTFEVEVVSVTPFAQNWQNCSLLRARESGGGVVIDPGGDLPRIRSALEA